MTKCIISYCAQEIIEVCYIKKDEVGEKCSMHAREDKCIYTSCSENLCENVNLGKKQDADGENISLRV
jgi:hypothetical protein